MVSCARRRRPRAGDEWVAGGYHSVLLTKDLKVFTFGAAQLGQLARPTVGGWTDSGALALATVEY